MDHITATLLDEDISILATTCIPSIEEANGIRSRNMMRRDKISDIDSQIDALHEPRVAEAAIDTRSRDTAQREEDIAQTDEIAALHALRHRLVKACDIGDATLAPIRRLPVEILAEIFVLCIPPLPSFWKPVYAQRWNDMPHRPFMDHGHPDWEPGPFKMTFHDEIREHLRKVCRLWRTILNDEPRVWSMLALDRPLPSPELAIRLLESSNPHPLDIYIRPCDWFRPDAWPGAVQTVLAALHRHLWRVRFLFADKMSHDETKVLFPPGLSMDLSMMQEIVYTQEDGAPVERPDLGAFRCPELRSITVVLSERMVNSLIVNPLPRVCYLEVTFVAGQSETSSLELLRALPNLVYLIWSTPDLVQEVPEELPKATLRSLKSLCYVTGDRGSMMRFLSSIHVPSLETLDIEFPDKHDPTHMLQDAIGIICGDGTVNLRHLHVYGGSLNEPDIGPILGYLNYLETLSVRFPRGGVIDRLLKALAPDNADISRACPQLTTFLFGPNYDFTDDDLHRMTALISPRHIRNDDFEEGFDTEVAIPGSCLKEIIIELD